MEDDDIVQSATSSLLAIPLDEDDQPDQHEDLPREFRLGFDTAGRLLEVIVLLLDEDREMAIHAMKARSKYRDLL